MYFSTISFIATIRRLTSETKCNCLYGSYGTFSKKSKIYRKIRYIYNVNVEYFQFIF